MILIIPVQQSLIQVFDLLLDQLQTILVIEYLIILFLRFGHQFWALLGLDLQAGHLQLQVPHLHGRIQQAGFEGFCFLPLLIQLRLEGWDSRKGLWRGLGEGATAIRRHHPDDAVRVHRRVAQHVGADRGPVHLNSYTITNLMGKTLRLINIW